MQVYYRNPRDGPILFTDEKVESFILSFPNLDLVGYLIQILLFGYTSER